MLKLDPNFWVLISAFSILLVHSIFPVIRSSGGQSSRILNSMSSGFGITHWLIFNIDALYLYADNLHKKFYKNFAGEFLIFVFLCFVMCGFLLIHGLDTITRFFKNNGIETPDLIYRIRLFILFLFNYSACHYIPISAHKESLEIIIYTIECIVVYSLADYSLSEIFPDKYNFSGRLFSILGVMAGILSGYFSPYQQHDWFMAFLDSFLMGCEMMLIITVEFSEKDTARHYWAFLFSVISMTACLGVYYFLNWNLLI